jgi:mRNA deadenylase 3'-5' endonuclease subunit Ccr4
MFSVVSLNILAKCYCRPEMFPLCSESDLVFESRMSNLESLLHRLDADILCLQEVDVDIQLNYSTAFGKRSRDKQDGCLTCWKSQRFTMQRKEIVEFNDVHMVALDRARVARDNVALIVQLFDGKRNRSVIVANTHLYYHPEYEDVRLVQTRYLLQKLEQFKGNQDCDVLLCGDFNATPFGAVYNYITQGSMVDRESKAPSIDRVKLLL